MMTVTDRLKALPISSSTESRCLRLQSAGLAGSPQATEHGSVTEKPLSGRSRPGDRKQVDMEASALLFIDTPCYIRFEEARNVKAS